MIKRFLGIGYESNVYLILANKKALIDTGTGFYSEQLIEELKKEVSLEEIEYIILTHEHFDHCGGAKDLKMATGAKICIHKNGAEVLEKGLNWSAIFFNAVQPKTEVDIKLEEGDIIDLGNIKLEVLHTPGHSEASICLYEEKSKSLFSGDTIFSYGGIGRTDFVGGDRIKLIESIKRLKKLEVNNLYPGHGEFIIGNAYEHIEMAERSALLF